MRLQIALAKYKCNSSVDWLAGWIDGLMDWRTLKLEGHWAHYRGARLGDSSSLQVAFCIGEVARFVVPDVKQEMKPTWEIALDS